jgi:hypothetical protein
VKVIDRKLLARVRRRACEVCDAAPPSEAHHLFTRGAGQLDLPINVVALCSFGCHYRHHFSGTPSTADLLAIVARREGVSVEDIQQTVWRYRRAGKDGTALRGEVAPHHDADATAGDGEMVSHSDVEAPPGLWQVGRGVARRGERDC